MVVDGPGSIPVPLSITEEPWVLGHWQAPTGTPNADRHPFQFKDWFVAHNGVIHAVGVTDTKHILGSTCPSSTDSVVIPMGIQLDGWEGLTGLNGTFACWAYNFKEKQVYLFRWVNPIYAWEDQFSSMPLFHDQPEKDLLEEGKVYEWPSLMKVSSFSPKEHPYK